MLSIASTGDDTSRGSRMAWNVIHLPTAEECEQRNTSYIQNLTEKERAELEAKKKNLSRQEQVKRELETIRQEAREKAQKQAYIAEKKKNSTENKLLTENQMEEVDDQDLDIRWITCKVCDGKKMNSMQSVRMHIESDFHKRRIEIFRNEKKGIDKAQILKRGENGWPDFVATRPYDFLCLICDAPSTSKESMEMHLAGKTHAKKLRMQEPSPPSVLSTNSPRFPNESDSQHSTKTIYCEICNDGTTKFRCFRQLGNHYTKNHYGTNYEQILIDSDSPTSQYFAYSFHNAELIFEPDQISPMIASRECYLPMLVCSPLDFLVVSMESNIHPDQVTEQIQKWYDSKRSLKF
jgi:Zinc-finger of C2H2 type